jgi:hypothetical protein
MYSKTFARTATLLQARDRGMGGIAICNYLKLLKSDGGKGAGILADPGRRFVVLAVQWGYAPQLVRFAP